MRREKSSNFLVFLFSLLIFQFIRNTHARKLQQIQCSSSCGDIKNIRYPFRLKGDPDGCGDSDYEFSCKNNKTILEFHSGKYYVKRISYEDHIITIVDVNLANGSCSLPQKSLSLHDMEADNLYATILQLTEAQFVRCSSHISESNPTYKRLPCLDGNHPFYVNYDGNYGSSRISDLPESCSFVSTVPINQSSVQYPSYEAIWKLLQSGFDLIWSVECRGCRSAGFGCYVYLSGAGQYNYDCIKQGRYFHVNLSTILLLPANVLLRIISTPLELLLILYWFYQFPPWISDKYLYERFEYKVQFPHWFYQILPWNYYLHPFLIYNLLAALVVVLIARFILVMVFVVFLIHKCITTKKTVLDNVEKFLYNQQSWMPKRYSYIEIIAITNHFRDKLGQGGFGSVYKGQLLNGNLVAVKVLANSKFSGEEFINEVSTIGRIHHANVVRLVGFCSEGSKRALVYEYMPNGSLDRHIFLKKGNGGEAFSWEKLHEIALGTARGIEYLHNGCDVCILHFDIKPHNIPLDHNFIPKVADFGLAKFYPKENDFICVSTTRGTIGYIAPELISRNFGAVSSKSDVYSFGMLLLEMAGGRRNSFANATHSSKAYFPSWAYDQIIEGRELELQNVNEIEAVIARKLCIIGLWCIQMKATDRPSISKVVEMLEGSIDDLQMPPKPFFSSSPRCSSIRMIQSDSSSELLEYSQSIGECSYIDQINDA